MESRKKHIIFKNYNNLAWEFMHQPHMWNFLRVNLVASDRKTQITVT